MNEYPRFSPVERNTAGRCDAVGIVLAGGRSMRFGSNKAFADWEGSPLVQAVVTALLDVLPKVLVVAKETAPFEFLKSSRVGLSPDAFSAGHPLGGIYSGLRELRSGYGFVCACDMPFIQGGLIEALWENRMGYDAVIPVWRSKLQPLCGLYSADCAPAVLSAIGRGRLSVKELLGSLPTRYYSQEEIEAWDPHGLSFFDLDTREDYSRARRLLPC